METMHLRAMNTDIHLAAEGQADQIKAGFELASNFIQSGESRFTRFSEESELSALNRSSGKRFKASADLFSVVALTRRFFHLTRGLFDPSILPDLKRVGYDRSMDVLRELGPSPLLETLLANERPSLIEMDLDESDHTILLPPGMALDLGGIAKGWIAEQAANLLSAYATACAVDAGGDMYLVGLPSGMEQWPVAVDDPLQPEKILTTLNVDPGAIATSTITKRVWQQAGKNRHHIIDPRTGEPAVSDWISVTVIAPHAYEAEVFAKALLIAGPQEAEEIIRHSGIPFTFLAIDQEKKIWGNQGIMDYSYVNTETNYSR
ncbi:MAG: FAD:protein FMN transferase [Anaerolineales bacterium]|jgi:thiamine biosynthesis lipoprotein